MSSLRRILSFVPFKHSKRFKSRTQKGLKSPFSTLKVRSALSEIPQKENETSKAK